MLNCRPFLALVLLSTTGYSQWLNYPTPGTPRTRDGKPNLSAPAPHASNGKPDLSGVWHVVATPIEEQKRLFGNNIEKMAVPGMERETMSKYGLNVLVDFKPEDSPMRPEATAILRSRSQLDRPSLHCLPSSLPTATLFSGAQDCPDTRLIVMILEVDGAPARSTPTAQTAGRSATGMVRYSTGKWEGYTLVVETAGFNDKSWLDAMGHPHSEEMRVTQTSPTPRFQPHRRRDHH